MSDRGGSGTDAVEAPAVSDQLPGPGSLRPSLGLAVLLSILFLTFLDNTVISGVLANVQEQLHAGVSELQWVVGGYALAFASLMLVCGSLGDNFGRKRLMLIGVVIFCAGSVVSALADTSTMLVVGRVVMGVGAAASEPGTLSMIRHIYPDAKRRARALGAWVAVSGLALAMGPVIGGILVGIYSWRAIFWFNLAYGAVVLVVAVLVLPESVNPNRSRIDVAGAVFGALAIGLATYATIAGETAGYRAASTVSLYVVSVLCLIAFIVTELRVAEPMLDLRFFRRPPFAGSTIVAFTSYFAIFSIFFFVALYLEVIASVGAYSIALDFLPLLAGMVAASLVTGRWVGASGTKVPMTVGCVLAAAGVLLTDLVIAPSAGAGTVGLTMGMAGIGFGIILVPVTSAALASVPAESSGMAASTTNTSRELGAVAGVAILGSIVNGQLTVYLTNKLIAIGIPAVYRAEILNAVTTGSLDAKARGLAGHSSAIVREYIEKIVNAAYGAFSHGLDIALGLSVALLAISAVVAYLTGTTERTGATRWFGRARAQAAPLPEATAT
jgi:EmrB/QacA subfamily drug resistance transporter